MNRSWLSGVTVCGRAVMLGTLLAWLPAPSAIAQVATVSSPPPGLQRHALSDEEIATLWASQPPRNAAHRSYIFIDEDDIVEAFDLPVFRVEALRSARTHQLEQMAGGDRSAAARIADLAPELARETVFRQRSEAAFYQRRPGVSRDVPQTPDVIVGPLLSFLQSRF